MGVFCGKLRRNCCCCCCCAQVQQNAAPKYKVLLLGATGSGKTHLGLLLSGQQSDANDLEPTNGVRVYQVEATATSTNSETVALPPDATLLLTEVGGSVDMQRIWSHYYANCHALIFCFDLSASNEALQANFNLLQQCLQHAALRGKPVLLVATRHRDGVQLYDVEHAFQLEQLARSSGSPLHICHLAGDDLMYAMRWLRRQLDAAAPALQRRIKYDTNLQSWQQRRRTLLSSGKLAEVHQQRFRRRQRKLWPLPQPLNGAAPSTSIRAQPRPNTAPAAIFILRTPMDTATS